MKVYTIGLQRGKEIIDVTGLDEPSKELAEELFYGEFGYTKQPEDRIVLIDSYDDGYKAEHIM